MRAFSRGPMPFLCVGHSFDHMFILLFSVVVLEVEREFGSVSYTHLTLPTIYSV